MKKILMLLVAVTASVSVFGQAQIVTKKMKLEDFTEKTTKIVLTGNPFLDGSLETDVKNCWKISPFEFCSMAEFNSLKTSDEYYFLIPVKGQFRKESVPGIEMLSLLKGGAEASKGLDAMLEVISIPLRAADFPSGRETVFLPALLDIIQEHVLASMQRDIDAYSGLSSYNMNIAKADDMKIVFSEDDLSSEITPAVKKVYFKGRAEITDGQTADNCIITHEPGTLVSYTVAPEDPRPGSYCYKMLIDAESHQLYYFRKHRITRKTGPGFLLEDIKRITLR